MHKDPMNKAQQATGNHQKLAVNPIFISPKDY
jgi:hypothetical protein